MTMVFQQVKDPIAALGRALARNDMRQIHEILDPVDSLTVPIDVFEAVPDHRRQRDTEKHARQWIKLAQTGRRSTSYMPAHRDVVVVVFPDGIWVLDGHTRRLLWSLRELELPPDAMVNMIVKHATSEKQAMEWYSFYDNAVAVETAADQQFGAYRSLGLSVSSPCLKSGNTQALRNAYNILVGNPQGLRDRGQSMRNGAIEEHELRELLSPTLYQIDRIRPNTKRFQAQILTVAIVTTIVDGPARALDMFFGPYLDESQYIQDHRGKNAIAHLWDLRNTTATADKRTKDGRLILGKPGMHHYPGSKEFENIQATVRLYEEHMFRHDRHLPRVFKINGFLKPGYRRTHRDVDFSRFEIDIDTLKQ